MVRKAKWIASGALAAALVAGGTGVALGAGGDDDDGDEVPITGPALEKASAAALADTAGGQVTGTEVGDEEGYYEVEVTLDDGSQVDVHLDRQFKVLDSRADDGDEDEDGDEADGGAGLPQGDDPVHLDPADFTFDIDNQYWPMAPGTQWTMREIDEEGTEFNVVITVTTETKEIANGVFARVVRDTVTEDGQLIEDTFDWYAQDADGNIWYLGEDTAEFEDGELVGTAGSFEAGVDGALPGIVMPADPEDGMRYRQEYYKGEAEDNGEILSTDEQADVPFGHFDDALLTKDTATIEPDVLEYKLYAPGVGPVLALGISGGGGREELAAFENVGAEIAKAAGTTPLGESYL